MKLRELIADLVHQTWSEWWEYQSSCSTRSMDFKGQQVENGTTFLTIPPTKVRRWDRQANTPYKELTPEEQKSDLEIADRYIELMYKKIQRLQYIEEAALGLCEVGFSSPSTIEHDPEISCTHDEWRAAAGHFVRMVNPPKRDEE